MKCLRQRKAFTIVEMVIVIAVIAILATVLVPTISGVIQKANKSADQQFAASLNVQLALWQVDNGDIASESDLRDAINYYYGTEEKLDFYAELTPKSGKQGYHYWWNATDEQVVLARYEDLVKDDDETQGEDQPTTIADEDEENEPVPTFSPANPRSLMIEVEEGVYKNYFLMDQAGSELTDIVVSFENLGDSSKVVVSESEDPAQQYEDVVNLLKSKAEAGSLEAALLEKVEVTTIVTGEGAYRYSDVNAIKHVYVPLSAKIINVQKVYVYDNTNCTVTLGTFDLATHAKVPVVQIPVGVKIASNGFPAMSECTDTTSASGNYQSATVLEILASDMSELTNEAGEFMFDVQTSNPVFKLSGSAQLYVVIDSAVYALPYNTGDAPVDVGGTIGTGTSGNLEVEVSFPNASKTPGEGTHYYDSSSSILYVQYDQTSVPITVKNGTYVNWSYELVTSKDEKTTDLISISDNKLEITKKISVSDNYQIRVIAKINGEEKTSFTVCLVMPREVQVGSYDSTNNAYGDEYADAIVLEYNTSDEFTFDFAVEYSANAKVAPWDIEVSSLNDNFSAALNEDKNAVTITLKKHEFSDDALVVKVGTETFKIKVKAEDKSGAAFTKAPVREGSTVLVGDNYLFRVGNQNAIALNKLFATTLAYNDIGIKFYDYSYSGRPEMGTNGSSQSVTVTGATKVEGYYYTATKDSWTGVTLKFANTGVVKIEIGKVDSNGTFTADTSVLLEVVAGKNITEYSQLSSSGNQVLWADITMSSDGTYALSNGTLYGNGYTFDVRAGAYAAVTAEDKSYVVSLSNATLNNVKIVGAVYTSDFGTSVKSDYHRACVLVQSNSAIYNSEISNCMSAVRVRNGATLVIENSTLKGGSFANLDIRDGKVTLENVTTINQVNGNDAATDGTVTVGLGIVTWYETVPNTATLTIKGTFNQYNFVSKTQATDNTVDNDYVSAVVDTFFGSGLSSYRYDDYVNTGILSLCSNFEDANVTNTNSTNTYTHNDATVTVGVGVTKVTINGHAWLMHTTASNYNSVPSGWTPKQYEIAPSYSFDYTSKNKVDKVDGSNDYCYHDGSKVLISMDEGDTFNWDPYILTATKQGNTLSYSVSMNGTTYASGNKIPFSTAGDYTVTYTYTDSNNYDKDGNSYSKTYTQTVNINVAVVKAAAKNAVFTFGSSNTASTKVTIGNATYVMPTTSSYSITVNGTTVYYTMVDAYTDDGYYTNRSDLDKWQMCFPVFNGAVTITDYADGGTGAAVVYNGSTTTIVTNPAVVGYSSYTSSAPSGAVGITTGDASKAFQYNASSTAGTAPVVQDSVLVYKSPELGANARDALYLLVKYSYQDNAGATYYYFIGYKIPAVTKASTCVTPETLVTMADGTQKMIKDVKLGENVIAWNFYTGKYEVVPVSLLQAHDTGYQNVLKLYFEDGTELNVLGEHGIYDADLNTFIFIDQHDAEDYVGHSFVKQNGEGFATTKLVGYEVVNEYTTAYTILSYAHYNVILDGMFTVTPAHVGGNFFNPFEVNADMMYDEAQMQADIEKYGLYTYEDFADYVTYEQFEALKLSHFKVSVGKGLVTYEGLVYLLEAFVNNSDFNVNN